MNKRSDGFHNLETAFYPLPFYDVLEILPNQQFSFQCTGIEIPGKQDQNLCVKAYQLLDKLYHLPPVKIHLHKVVPLGAGLGGGSSDGAHTLILLNQLFTLGISKAALLELALQLGSDCPFFVLNEPCYATGRGEILEPIPLRLEGWSLVLVNPGITVNTGWAFSQVTYANDADSHIKETLQLPVTEWKNQLFNGFEASVFTQWPEIATIKSELYQQGAVFASMSGSGSTVFGLFSQKQPGLFSFPPHYFVKTLAL